MRKNAGLGLYAASVVLPPLLLLLADARNWQEFWIRQWGLALTAVAVALAATSSALTGATPLGLTAAILWLMAMASFALTTAINNLAHRFGSAVADGWAALFALTALAFGGLAFSAFFRRRDSTPTPVTARLLCGSGLGLLALYLARVSARLYVMTRVTESDGLAAIEDEAVLRFWIGVAVSGLLIGGTLIRHLRTTHAPKST